jgi:hypothetical protein
MHMLMDLDLCKHVALFFEFLSKWLKFDDDSRKSSSFLGEASKSWIDKVWSFYLFHFIFILVFLKL